MGITIMKAKLINAAIGTLQIIQSSSLVGFSGMVLAIGMQGCNNRWQSNFEQLGYKYQQVFKDELRKMVTVQGVYLRRTTLQSRSNYLMIRSARTGSERKK